MALHLFSIHIVKKLLHDLSSRYKLSKTTHLPWDPISLKIEHLNSYDLIEQERFAKI